jgi:hypothetical protein
MQAATATGAAKWLIPMLIVAVNTMAFVLAPFYWSYRSVTAFEHDLSARTLAMRRHLNPADTLIVGFDSHFLGFRHAGYALPEFTTVLYPEVRYPEGPRVFLMKAGDTRLAKSLSRNGFQRFVLYPLPLGAAYAEYVDGVLSKLPAGTLTKIELDSQPVWAGPISALPLLFPAAGR